MSKTQFTSNELENKGFKLETDYEEVYFTYLDNPKDKWGSTFIATNSVYSADWLADFNNSILFSVIAPPTEDSLERYMTEEEIDLYISNSKAIDGK